MGMLPQRLAVSILGPASMVKLRYHPSCGNEAAWLQCATCGHAVAAYAEIDRYIQHVRTSRVESRDYVAPARRALEPCPMCASAFDEFVLCDLSSTCTDVEVIGPASTGSLQSRSDFAGSLGSPKGSSAILGKTQAEKHDTLRRVRWSGSSPLWHGTS